MTMLRRKEFSMYTKILRDNNIQYRWGFPVKLIIFLKRLLYNMPRPLHHQSCSAAVEPPVHSHQLSSPQESYETSSSHPVVVVV